MKRLIHPFFFLLFALVGCKSCEPEPPKPPPLPNAAFEIGEETQFDFFPADTIDLIGSKGDGSSTAFVTFKAQDVGMDRYEWTIGTDGRKFTDRAFTLYFNGPDQINVKLKVTKNGKADSLTKPLVLRRPHRPKLAGVWEGSFTHKPDSIFRIYILNGLTGQERQGDVDTADGWPTGARGFRYVFKGMGSFVAQEVIYYGLYADIFIVTNGGSVFNRMGSRNGFNYGDTIRFFGIGNNRIKIKASLRRAPNVFIWDKREFDGHKIRW